MITFQVEEQNGTIKTIEIPEGISLNLMEVLKASEYDILATCGGMALCATCHVEVKKGAESLGDRNDAEWDRLDTLPNATPTSRLACQIQVGEQLNGVLFVLKEASA